MWRLYLDENVSAALIAALLALGFNVVSTAQLGRKGATDVSQLLFAARDGRVLITYDTDHFEIVHEAWRSFALEWGVHQRARHPGILGLPDPGLLKTPDAAALVDELFRSGEEVENRLLVWRRPTGWREIG